MSRELTREEKAAIRALVVKWCANYDRECGCLPLDCECYMLGKCWTGAYCRYFRGAVLPLDPAARSAAGPFPRIGGRRTARRPVQRKPTAASRGNICGKSGAGVLTIRPLKTRLYQGFPGLVLGRAVCCRTMDGSLHGFFHPPHRTSRTVNRRERICPRIRNFHPVIALLLPRHEEHLEYVQHGATIIMGHYRLDNHCCQLDFCTLVGD